MTKSTYYVYKLMHLIEQNIYTNKNYYTRVYYNFQVFVQSVIYVTCMISSSKTSKVHSSYSMLRVDKKLMQIRNKNSVVWQLCFVSTNTSWIIIFNGANVATTYIHTHTYHIDVYITLTGVHIQRWIIYCVDDMFVQCFLYQETKKINFIYWFFRNVLCLYECFQQYFY